MDNKLQEATQLAPQVTTLGWVFGLSLMGGIVRYWRNAARRHPAPIKLAEVVGELTTSAFAGLVAYHLCDWLSIQPALTAAMGGIAGLLGNRALRVFEKLFQSKFNIGGDEK